MAAVGQQEELSSDETNVAAYFLRLAWKNKLVPIPPQRVVKRPD